MLNSQLYMPENEDKKQGLIDCMMAWSPGLGNPETNFDLYRVYYEQAKISGLFTNTELETINQYWDRYWNYYYPRIVERNKAIKPWYKRFSEWLSKT